MNSHETPVTYLVFAPISWHTAPKTLGIVEYATEMTSGYGS